MNALWPISKFYREGLEDPVWSVLNLYLRHLGRGSILANGKDFSPTSESIANIVIESKFHNHLKLLSQMATQSKNHWKWTHKDVGGW
jgi:hypothetical protein